MNSAELHKILSRDPFTMKYFVGVFPSDKIPELSSNRSFAMVINTDKSTEPGSHWVAIFVENNKKLEFFDSYGLPPDAYGSDIKHFITHYPEVSWNKICFQSLTSNVCGPYCIYYLVKRCQGLCMYSIVSHLVGKNNDFRMFQFVKRRYGVKLIFKK